MSPRLRDLGRTHATRTGEGCNLVPAAGSESRPGILQTSPQPRRDEQVAIPLQAGEDLVRAELCEAGTDLVPGARRGDGRGELAAQRVGGRGRARRVVLAPIDEDLAGPLI